MALALARSRAGGEVREAVKPFVLLASPRTGSTMLGHALAAHPDLVFYGELFHALPARRADEAARRTMGSGVPCDLGLPYPACADDVSGAEYLAGFFARELGPRALGFKLFYAHARTGPLASAWDYLAQRHDLHVLHLTRRDLLASAVSYFRAKRTGEWHRRIAAPAARPHEPFRIERDELVAFLSELDRVRAQAAPLLSGRPVLELVYEELQHSPAALLASAYDFLGVAPLAAPPASLARIASLPVPAELLNYAELAHALAATPYAALFQHARG